jgi:post-segregation antitoxin (ccd killing protein)
MSKRLQILLSDKDHTLLRVAAKKRGLDVSKFVRLAIYRELEQNADGLDQRMNRLMRLASHEGPTGNIEQILSEIEQGKSIKLSKKMSNM